jgi:hypothetical protein
MHNASSRKFEGELFFFNLPNPSSSTRPWCLQQKLVPEAEKEYFWGIERGLCGRLATLPPSVSRVS